MRDTATMSITACVGLKETLAANRPDQYTSNQFIGKNFFDGENYRAAIERLDGGYEVSMDIIEWMQDFCDTERAQSRNLISYADKWTSRLKQQSSLTSYHTTKRAQLDVVNITKKLAQVKESTCLELEKVIEKYRTYVTEIYVSERFRPGRKHRRSNELKKSFKNAYASLREVNDEFESLQNQERKARDALRAADSACENLELDATATDKQRLRAGDVQAKKRTALSDVEKRLAEMKDRRKVAQRIYRNKATEIFRQCQNLEEERLEQIRETLLDFIQAMYTTEFAADLSEIYEGVAKKVTTQQNSFDDLLFWAKTYGIENKLTKSMTFTTSDDEENHHVKEVTRKAKRVSHQNNIDEDEEEEEEPSTVTNRTKARRPKSSVIHEKKTGHSHEPSTINNTVLNQV